MIKIKPKLRFKGFHGEWIQEKISEVAIINPKNKLNEDFYYIDLDSVKNGQIKNYRIENKDSAPSRAQRVAEINDIFYQTVRPYQKNNVIFDIKSNNQFVFSSGYAQLRINNDIDVKMIYQITLTHKFTTKVLNLCTGTSYPAVNANDLGNINISIPEKIEEQQKIGAFFSKLDQLIDLQAHKIDQLQRLKRGYLQKLFPQPGEVVPRLRFKGFTDEWKEKKLGEIGSFQVGGDVDKRKLNSNGKYPVIANNLSNNGIVGYYNDYYKIDSPAVTITGRGTIGVAKFRDYKFTPIVRLLVFKSNCDLKFLELSINNIRIFNESTGVPQLTAPQLKRYTIMLPKNSEQKKIGQFFKNIDQSIELQNKKLDELKQLKKAYLQKMFI